MYLDRRSSDLLLEIIRNPNLSFAHFQEKYELSYRQIEYTLEKINEWLDYNDIKEIIYKEGEFILPKGINSIFYDDGLRGSTFYVMSQKERYHLILLQILLRDEVLSLDHLTQKTGVSRNTIINDIKVANNHLNHKGVQISYNRSIGYFLEGREWNKRILITEIVIHLATNKFVFKIIKEIVKEEYFRLKRIERLLIGIESDTNQNFIDERLKTLPYELVFILMRIERGHHIEKSYNIQFDDLSDTKEYKYIEQFLKTEKIEDEAERLFLTIYILSVNRSISSSMDYDEILSDSLSRAIEEFIRNFEINAVVRFHNRENLIYKLFHHLKPAYYRIKYNLTTQHNSIFDYEEQLLAVNYFVTRSMGPLNNLFERNIPHYEVLYISLIVSSHLTKRQRNVLNDQRLKAVIVCPNGITMSTVVKNNLKMIFPEIDFYETMSIREYENGDSPHDLVFSTVPLKPKPHTKMYVVNTMMLEIEKIRLRERVVSDLFNPSESQVDVNELIKVISKHAEIEEVYKLQKDLEKFFSNRAMQKNRSKIDIKTFTLVELLSFNFLQITEKDLDWEEALVLASQPLINEEIIELRYVDRMKELYPNLVDNLILNNNIAIPHAGIEDGVNSLGMSMLVLKNPQSKNKLGVSIIVVVATPNKKQHIKPLMELVEIAKDDEFVSLIQEQETENDIIKLLKSKER